MTIRRIKTPRPAKILFTLPNFDTAGSGRAMLNIVERLDRTLFEPAVCIQRLGGRLCEEVRQKGIELIVAPFTVPAHPYHTLPLRAWAAAKVFRPYRFDLWSSFHYLDDYTEPIIARMSGARAWLYTKKNMSWNNRSWYLRTAFATAVAAQNPYMLTDFFGRRGFRRKAKLIQTSVDAERFHPNTPPRLRMRERLGTPSSAIVVVCVAHLSPVKKHEMLIRAAALTPGVHYWLAGNPLQRQYTASLRALVEECGVSDRVLFLENVEDVPALLVEADIFAMQSKKEGCPIALLEAMAAGLPAVGSDIPGLAAVIDVDETGLLAPPNDHVAMAGCIRKLAADDTLRKQMGMAARAKILANFQLDREVRQYAELYGTVLGMDPSRMLPR